MNQTVRIELNKVPGKLGLVGRALLSRTSRSEEKVLPEVEIRLSGMTIDPKQVVAYQQICGFEASDSVPATFPHTLAFPLHIELMLQKGFPFALPGLVHIRNEITQHRAVRQNEKLDILCCFSGIRETDKGHEFDVLTTVYVGSERVWESVSTNLGRRKSGKRGKRATHGSLPVMPEQEFWNLPENLGRRYASVSGDYNPIHLARFSARLFGFRGHIAHGMWTKARAIATLSKKLVPEACRISVEFKLPLYLPGKAQLCYQQDGQSIVFDVRDRKGEKPHLRSEINLLSGD